MYIYILVPSLVMQTNIDPDFFNKGYLGNITGGGIKLDKDEILIRGNLKIL